MEAQLSPAGDKSFCDLINKVIDEFLINNQKDNVSPSLLWETLKAVIRGEIIAFSSLQNKVRREKQDKLLKSIRELDSQNSMTPSPDLSKRKLNLQKEYDLLSTGKVERQLLRARGLNYESGEKAGRLLAHQLKVKANSQHTSQIKNSLNQLTIIPSEINNVFKEFYSTLYQSESPPNDTDMEMFFEGIIFPKIGNDQAGNLEQPWNISEITKSIKAIQSGKTPGPDGFPI